MIELAGGWLDLSAKVAGPYIGTQKDLSIQIRSVLQECMKDNMPFALVLCPTKRFRQGIHALVQEECTDKFYCLYISNDRPLRKYVKELEEALGKPNFKCFA